jgi:hypothetical protein
MRESLFPVGYRVKVQLEEDGRKKRSTADASYWSFHSGEMVLFFEPNPDSEEEEATAGIHSISPATNGPTAPVLSGAELEIQQCVQALDDAEKRGKQFIAYKWFRDLVLAGLPHGWAKDAERRQQVLAASIDAGRISVQKIPNPRQPAFPTTTLSVNRSAPAAGIKPRFRPVQVLGEPVSTTLLRDRG